MRKLKCLILAVVLIMFLSALTSCTCEPYSRKWYLYDIEEEITFSNGTKAQIRHNGAPSILYPWESAHMSRCEVEFLKDLTFKMNLDGEELAGTYLYKNNGITDTTFLVKLENGESFDGRASSGYFGAGLEFEFRGSKYSFNDSYSDSYDDEAYNEMKQWQIDKIRYMSEHGVDSFKEGNITFTDGEYILNDDYNSYNLSSDETYVWCSYLDKNNELTNLNEILIGQCYYGFSKSQNNVSVLIVYYVEPLPEIKQTEPVEITSTLGEVYQWLNSNELESLKVTRRTIGLDPGYTDYHSYLSEKTSFMEYSNVKLTEVREEEVREYLNKNEMYTWIELKSTIDGQNHKIVFYEKYVYKDVWWEVENFPGFNYQNATRSFVTKTNDITVFDGEEQIAIYKNRLRDIEFVICKEEHHYTTQTPKLKVVTDFGELVVYDGKHFWYKGQSYVVVGSNDFEFIFT